MRPPCAAALLLAAAPHLSAALSLPNAVSSNMVLQRSPQRARLWGWGTPGEKVTATVSPGGASASTTAGPQTAPEGPGYWVVDLPPHPAGTGFAVALAGAQSGTATLDNVAFGDVWLCSGQSNMQFTVSTAYNASAEEADAERYPDLRMYTQCDFSSDAPMYNGSTPAPYSWAVSDSASVRGKDWTWFSAACYFMGRDLYLALGGKVPIGLVASTWGGQKVEQFSSPDALNDTTCGGVANGTGFDPTNPLGGSVIGLAHAPGRSGIPAAEAAALAAEADAGRFYASADGDNCPKSPPPAPTKLWFGQIYPLLPMRFVGAAWYQGESNVGDPPGYACRFPAMITDWRRKFGLPNMTFLFVELAAFTQQDYSEIRAAQMVALRLPKTGYATAIDIGDPTSPFGAIHPRRKQEVGRRLSLAALKVEYGMPVTAYGPSASAIADAAPSPSGFGGLVFSFRDAEGLHFAGTAVCTDCCNQSPFELLIGGHWSRAPFALGPKPGQVTVRANSSGTIGGVRYSWDAYPQCALYNGAGGPDNHTGIAAAPFHWTPPPASYHLVARQTYDPQALWSSGEVSVNPSKPWADQHAVLDTVERYRSSAADFTFRMRWPLPNETQVWRQQSNPVTSTTVEGYEAIAAPFATDGWAGLARSSTTCAVLDGSVGERGVWFYAVGDLGCNWGRDGIPGPSRAAQVTELHAFDPVSGRWTLIFRQTWPYSWPSLLTLSYNTHDEGSDMFSRLGELESFRDPQTGLFTLRMFWPDNGNTWRQQSNPITSKPGIVTGYAPLSVQHTDNGFGGLERNPGNESLLDGSIGSPDWFYAVGMSQNWGSIPAWSTGLPVAELYVRSA